MADTPTLVAYEFPDPDERWARLTWREVGQQVRALAAGLRSLGVQRGDRIALMADTSVDWALAAHAIHAAGAAVVTLHTSASNDDLAHILADSEPRVVWVDTPERAEQLDGLLGEIEAARILGSGEGPEGWLPLPALRRRGRTRFAERPTELDEVEAALGHDDLAALVYTSGTTGTPRGAMLPHLAFVAVCHGVEAHLPLEPTDKQYLFLPLSHVLGLVCLLAAMHVGAPTAIDGRFDHVRQGLEATSPTFFAGVPRVFEKVVATAEAQAARRGPAAARVFRWAWGVARDASQRRQAGRRVPRRLRARLLLADRLVYRRLRAALGGRIRGLASGGAPLDPRIAHLFHTAGMPVLEGYGLTESCGLTTVNRLDQCRIGTVGLPDERMEIRIADDGEVLLRGPTLMTGYWRLPRATAETIDEEGWLHTGDVGELDDDGFLRITDRKKNLIVTAQGKNVAPARVEQRLTARCPIVGTALLLGDRRPACVALLGLDGEALEDEGYPGDVATASRDPEILARVERAVAEVNATVASWERIRAWRVLDHEPTVATGELTPSLKIRRAVWAERHADLVEALYAELAARPRE